MARLSELTPLLKNDESPLNKCFLEIINHDSRELSPCESKLVITSKIAIFIISATAKIFFIPISLRLPGGPFFAAGNTLGFLKLEYWAGSRTIDDMMISQSEAEKALTNGKKRSKMKNVSLGIVAWMIAAPGQIPFALAAVSYNSDQFKIVAAIVMIVSGSIFPTRSIQLSLSKVFQKKTLNEQMNKYADLKRQCADLILSSKGVFIQSGKEAQLRFIQTLDEERNLSNNEEKIDRYLAQVLFLGKDSASINSKSCSVMISGGIGLVLTGIFQTAIALYTWYKTKEEVYDNDVLAGVFTALALSSSLYLTGKSIISTTQRCLKSISNFFTCNREKSLSEQLRPKRTFCIRSIGLIIDLLALGPTIVVWGDFFNRNEFEQRFFQITIALAVFMLLFTSTLDIVDDVVEKQIQLRGAEDEKKILEMKNEFHRLEDLIQKSPLLEFAATFQRLPQDVRNQLLEKFNLTSKDLNQLTILDNTV